MLTDWLPCLFILHLLLLEFLLAYCSLKNTPFQVIPQTMRSAKKPGHVMQLHLNSSLRIFLSQLKIQQEKKMGKKYYNWEREKSLVC